MSADYTGWIGRETIVGESLSSGMVEGLLATLDRPGAFASGHPAPLGAHWLLAPPRVPMREMGTDGHPKRGGFLPPIAARRRMWAASEVEFAAPLFIGVECRRHSRIADVAVKQGKGGPLWLVTVDHRIESDGRVAIRERQTIIYLNEAPQAASDSLHTGDWQFRESLLPHPVLLFRYSALTFNAHRIHYDLPYATEEEGYPGLVVHGPLIATLLLDLCARSFGGKAVSRFRFRARSPAFASELLRLAARREGQEAALAATGPRDRLLTTASAELRTKE